MVYYINVFLYVEQGFSGGSVSKESACNAEDLGSIPGLGRSPGGGHGNSLHWFLPGESLWTVHGVPNSRTQLSDFHYFEQYLYPGIKSTW